MLAPILVVVLAVIWIALGVFAFRNVWVYNHRSLAIDQFYGAVSQDIRSGAYQSWPNGQMPSFEDVYLTYDQMLLRFWVWNIDRLKKIRS